MIRVGVPPQCPQPDYSCFTKPGKKEERASDLPYPYTTAFLITEPKAGKKAKFNIETKHSI
jgi:hypothetical protein